MDGVVRTDQEIGAHLRELVRRGEHQVAHRRPVVAIEVHDVIGQRRRVHGHFGMRVLTAHQIRALDADRAVAEGRTLGRAGDDADVLRHQLFIRRRPRKSRLPSGTPLLRRMS